MAEERDQRRLAAILAADVVGYSRLMEQDEAGTLAALKERRKGILQPLVAEHRGRIVKVMGDGVLVEFASAVNAVQCAVDLQRGMAVANGEQTDSHQIVLRIGVNLGDVIVEGSDLYGDGVNVAARLEALAAPGGILISGTAYDYVRNKVKVAFDDLGAQTLKNIAEPVRMYSVVGTPVVATATFMSVSDKPSIAVLPFVNISDDPAQKYFSDGVTEDIITDLTRFRELFVIARHSSFQYEGKSADVKQVGRELGVQYVVRGSVRKAGKQVRIAVQLIDAATGNQFWAERYDRDLHDIFALQDELAHAVAATVSGRIEAIGRDRVARLSPTRLKAYDLLLRAKALFLRYTSADNEQARVLARRAIELDPTNAAAHAYYAYCCFVVYVAHWSADRAAFHAEAFEFAQRAVGLDESDTNARWVLGVLHLSRRDYEEARIHIEKAFEYNPNDSAVRRAYALYLTVVGRPSAAIEHFEIMKRQNPFDLTWTPWIKGWTYLTARRYDDAIASFKEIHEPLNEVRGCLAASYAHAGRLAEARAALEEFFRVAARDMAIFPGRQLGDWIQFWRDASWYRNEADFEHLLDGLRKAGLME